MITGKVDIATDGKKTYRIGNGHPMMTHVVGTGCMAASVIGAFAAVERDLSLAAACALACYGIAAEVAAEKASGPASFKERLFDCLYNLDRDNRGPDAEDRGMRGRASDKMQRRRLRLGVPRASRPDSRRLPDRHALGFSPYKYGKGMSGIPKGSA